MTPNTATASRRTLTGLRTLLGIFIACRLVLLVFAPHQDPSEARYAEISRKMVETGDWITPQHFYGIPFWAKPPLSMWMSAAGMELFGVNEFGSRLLIFLAALAVLTLVAFLARREWSPVAGGAAAAMMMGMPLFFYCSAAVMTDLALAAGTTLAMVAFWFAMKTGSKRWGYALFAGLAIGLLAKGPLTLVIAVPPIVGWIVLNRRVNLAWKSIPWLSGTLLMLALAAPWYAMAEHKTPGFLDYFLVGEHWKRFTVKGWEGDLYGSAHAELPGTIWLFALSGTFPWCLGLLALPFRRWRDFRPWAFAENGRGLYLMLWAIWPILFFTPARNIISTYPLPALPAIALLLAGIFEMKWNEDRRFHPLHPVFIAVGLGLVSWAMIVTLVLPQHSPKHSERELVKAFHQQSSPGDVLIYYGKRKYSGEFYTAGKALNTRSFSTLAERLDAPGNLFLAINPGDFMEFPISFRQRFHTVGSWGKDSTLYAEINPPKNRVTATL